MKIVVLTGSPRRNGNSNQLADAFCAGAMDAGHKVFRYDAATLKINPCKACEWCREHGGRCISNDAMSDIYGHLLAADLLVLATPIYYFGMSAQLKAAVDRLHALSARIKGKQAILLATCGDTEDTVADALLAHFSAICTYCEWEQVGLMIARGVYEPDDIAGTDFISKARAMGRNLGKAETTKEK